MPALRLRFTVGALLVTLSAVWTAAQAPGLRAQYVLSDIEWSGEEVVLTMAMRVTNETGKLALVARISLDHPDAPDDREGPTPASTFATFELNNIRPRESVRLEQRIHLPGSEFTRWRDGYLPSFSMWFFDESGSFTRESVAAQQVPELPYGRMR